ncbi:MULTISPECIES: hypothetical protein [unclassified Adlercreutzia]|uniref:hypothetical protein n=1 Tax=unclassified Adlercreutzia TaxID=2636013 RepID=UPI0013EAA1EA|nr:MULTISPECIES: hypothetical protein [unclassified Adlercreutzia]
MSEFFENLSAYDLINTLVPGIMVMAVCDGLGLSEFMADSPVIAFAACYVFGIVASRIGSVILEPLAIKYGKVSQYPYPAYVKACAKDEGLKRISMVANSYRSFLGSIVLCAVLALVALFSEEHRRSVFAILTVGVFVLLLKSWFKQERYVAQRVDAWQKEDQGVGD